MLTEFTSILKFFTKIQESYNKNKLATILSIICFSLVIYYNIDNVKELIYGKNDITLEYLDKTIEIENDLRKIRNHIDSDAVSIFLLHNGEVSISKLHMMKFSLVFQSSETNNNHKYLLDRQSLSPYTSYFQQMLERGYYVIEDAKNHEDILIRTIVYLKYKNVTQLYIPIYNQKNVLIGFGTVDYKKKKKLTNTEIEDIKRLFKIPQSHL